VSPAVAPQSCPPLLAWAPRWALAGVQLWNGSGPRCSRSQADGKTWEMMLRGPSLLRAARCRAEMEMASLFLVINYTSNWRAHCRVQLVLSFPPSLVPFSCPCFSFHLFSQTPCLLIIREMTSLGCGYRNFQLARVIGCM